MNQFKYYSDQILNSMNTIESLTLNGMFHELYPEIECKFWIAHDSKDIKKMKFINAQLSDLIDHKREINAKERS